MQQISFFLERFKKLGLDKNLSVSIFINVVGSVIKTKLPAESVSFKDGTFFVRAHPTLKSELFLKKEKILTELSKLLSSQGERKIR